MRLHNVHYQISKGDDIIHKDSVVLPVSQITEASKEAIKSGILEAYPRTNKATDDVIVQILEIIPMES